MRAQLIRLGFRSEDVLDGRPLDSLSADEVYVLAKSLPNFTAGQKREAYRAIVSEALESGQARVSDSLQLLGDVRQQLGLSTDDHNAILQSLGIEDASLLDTAKVRSVEDKLRFDNYRQFLQELVEAGLASGQMPALTLSSKQSADAIRRGRLYYYISEADHERILGKLHSKRRSSSSMETGSLRL